MLVKRLTEKDIRILNYLADKQAEAEATASKYKTVFSHTYSVGPTDIGLHLNCTYANASAAVIRNLQKLIKLNYVAKKISVREYYITQRGIEELARHIA